MILFMILFMILLSTALRFGDYTKLRLTGFGTSSALHELYKESFVIFNSISF